MTSVDVEQKAADWLASLDDALQALESDLREMDFSDNQIMPYRIGEDGMPVERYDDLAARLHVSNTGVVHAEYRNEQYVEPESLATKWVEQLWAKTLHDRLIEAVQQVDKQWSNTMQLLEDS